MAGHTEFSSLGRCTGVLPTNLNFTFLTTPRLRPERDVLESTIRSQECKNSLDQSAPLLSPIFCDHRLEAAFPPVAVFNPFELVLRAAQ